MFTVIVWEYVLSTPILICQLSTKSAEDANKLANTLFECLDKVVVEIEDKNGEIVKKLRHKC